MQRMAGDALFFLFLSLGPPPLIFTLGECKVKDFESKIRIETILFFDLDGTLVETDYANFLAYNKAIKSVLNKSIIFNPNERFTREKLFSIFTNLTKTEIVRIIERKEMYYKEYLTETKLNETIYQVLNKYHKTNRTFLVTNCRKNRALLTLRHHNIEDKFEKLFYRQFNKNKKVNKFKNAISDLNITPHKIILFENEQAEILDAIDSGIPPENIITIK